MSLSNSDHADGANAILASFRRLKTIAASRSHQATRWLLYFLPRARKPPRKCRCIFGSPVISVAWIFGQPTERPARAPLFHFGPQWGTNRRYQEKGAGGCRSSRRGRPRSMGKPEAIFRQKTNFLRSRRGIEKDSSTTDVVWRLPTLANGPPSSHANTPSAWLMIWIRPLR
jgi:hypothetical protein